MRKLVISICLLAGASPVFPEGDVSIVGGPSSSKWQDYAVELKDALLACSSADERGEVARSHLGTVLRTHDGGSIAIAYMDSHFAPMVSPSVAVTSDGRWMTCDFHFCGMMAGYREGIEKLGLLAMPRAEALARIERMTSIQQKIFSAFYAVETSQTLDDGVRILRNFGFTETTPDRIVKNEGEPGATDNP